MGNWEGIARVFVVGVVSIGLVTALFAPGRQTVSAIKAGGSAAQGLLHTAESG
jgi:hypothetical protein